MTSRASVYYGTKRIGRVISVLQYDNGMVEIQLLANGIVRNTWVNLTQVEIKEGP